LEDISSKLLEKDVTESTKSVEITHFRIHHQGCISCSKTWSSDRK